MVALDDREVLDTGMVAWKDKSGITMYDFALTACGMVLCYKYN